MVVFFITTVSFNRINRSILALEKIERGELEKTDENDYTLFTSDNDEVSRLQRSIEEYREHRIEAEAQRKERARRRDERDSIMFEKMSVLSQQLEGNARDMLVQEIMDMRDKLSSGNDEDKDDNAGDNDNGDDDGNEDDEEDAWTGKWRHMFPQCPTLCMCS